MTHATVLGFLDTYSGTVSGRVTDFLAGETVKCETVTCTEDVTRVIHWKDGTPGGILEGTCARHGSMFVHPSREHLHAVDVTAHLTPVS